MFTLFVILNIIYLGNCFNCERNADNGGLLEMLIILQFSMFQCNIWCTIVFMYV